MEVKIDKSFLKDTRKIHNKAISIKIAEIILNIQEANNLNQIKNLKKLKGRSNEFRIKVFDYRIGIIITNSVVELIRCLHRKDIYKYFPK